MNYENLREFLSDRTPIELMMPFVPAWGLALVLGWAYRSVAKKSTSQVDAWQGWLVLPILAWALTAAFRSIGFWNSLAVCHQGAEPPALPAVAASNLFAGCVLIVFQVLAMGAAGGRAWTLGLSGGYRFVAMLVVVQQAYDCCFLLTTLFTFTKPRGLPLPL